MTIENILCGCDNTVIGSNIRRIREMTPAGVQQLARKYLCREDLVTMVAGRKTGRHVTAGRSQNAFSILEEQICA